MALSHAIDGTAMRCSASAHSRRTAIETTRRGWSPRTISALRCAQVVQHDRHATHGTLAATRAHAPHKKTKIFASSCHVSRLTWWRSLSATTRRHSHPYHTFFSLLAAALLFPASRHTIRDTFGHHSYTHRAISRPVHVLCSLTSCRSLPVARPPGRGTPIGPPTIRPHQAGDPTKDDRRHHPHRATLGFAWAANTDAAV